MLAVDGLRATGRALAAAFTSATLGEIGRPGTKHLAGKIITEEYVPELTGTRALTIFDKMRTSDGAVAATLRSLKLPLRAAKWDVEPPENPSDLEREVTDRVRFNLFEGMSMTWEDHLRQLLTHLDFGHYVCEKVWQVSEDAPATTPTLEFRRGRGEIGADVLRFNRDDGTTAVVDRKTFYLAIGRFAREPQITLRKLAPRQQRTINKWNTAQDGGLVSVEQMLPLGSDIPRATIPIDKLLVFVNEKEGANWTGRSVLRPAYKHWFLKDLYYRVDSIATERFGVGIPIMKVPKDKAEDSQTRDRVAAILQGVQSHEKAYIIEIEGYEFRVDIPGGRGKEALPMINHHDWMIAVSVMAQHLMLGAGDTGSHALSGDITSLFLMALAASGREICSVHDRYLIPQMVRWNYPGVTRFPHLTVGRIETRDTGKLIGVVSNAVQAGAMAYDRELDNFMRGALGAPALQAEATKVPDALDGVDLMAKRAEAVGALIRAGFEADAAREAVGLPPIKHTGLLPITVTKPDGSTPPQPEGGASA